MLSDLLLLAPAAIVFVVLMVLTRRNRVVPKEPPAEIDDDRDDAPPANAIVVDGSNVMHWGGDPSPQVLSLVLRAIENKGYAPIVFFDANVGYKLGDRYFDELKMARVTGVTKEHICIVEKGVVADEGILAFSRDHNLRIVTQDKYRDWRGQFPHAKRKGVLVSGTFVSGVAKLPTL